MRVTKNDQRSTVPGGRRPLARLGAYPSERSVAVVITQTLELLAITHHGHGSRCVRSLSY